MEEIELKLTIDEVNTILKILSNEKYSIVSGIIYKIKKQGDEQYLASKATEQK